MTEPQAEPLPSYCKCDRRVRLLWVGPISAASRPVLLVCGWYPKSRCGLRMRIPREAIRLHAVCRHCNDITESQDDPAPDLCVMCAKLERACPSCGGKVAIEPYDIGSGPELSCPHCDHCWGAEGQPLLPYKPDLSHVKGWGSA